MIFSVNLDLGLCRNAKVFWCAGPRVRLELMVSTWGRQQATHQNVEPFGAPEATTRTES